MSSIFSLAHRQPSNLAALEARQSDPQGAFYWLAENLDLLATALDLNLAGAANLTGGNNPSGALVARDVDDDSLALITYFPGRVRSDDLYSTFSEPALSSVDAILWLAESFDEQSLAVIRHLNEIHADQCRYYAVRLRLADGDMIDLDVALDVMEAPDDWVPPIERLAPIAHLGFPSGFWAFHLHRHPGEALRSRWIAQRCRWRATKLRGVGVGQHLQEDGASVFFCNPGGGAQLEQVKATLAPFAATLEQRLGVAFSFDDTGWFAKQRLVIPAQHSSNWRRVSDWFRTQSTLYAAVLDEVTAKSSY